MTTQARRFAKYEPVHRLPIEQVGGGSVIRSFRMNGEIVRVGTRFTGDEIRSWQAANRRELLDRFLCVWPKAPDGGIASTEQVAAAERAERHVVSLGFRTYAVIEGVRLNAAPLSREDAYKLAGKPDPKLKEG